MRCTIQKKFVIFIYTISNQHDLLINRVLTIKNMDQVQGADETHAA
jgi:hypothetical protein